MKPCKTCKEFSCGANGSDYVSMRCGSEEGFIRVAADCLQNAAELVDRLRWVADFQKYEKDSCVVLAADAIETLMQENAKLKAERDAAPQWISVKERLPEDERLVLGLMLGKFCFVGSCRPSDKTWFCATQSAAHPCKKEVTHWMPLPEAPKEEE